MFSVVSMLRFLSFGLFVLANDPLDACASRSFCSDNNHRTAAWDSIGNHKLTDANKRKSLFTPARYIVQARGGLKTRKDASLYFTTSNTHFASIKFTLLLC